MSDQNNNLDEEPTAYAFEVKPTDPEQPWQETVKFKHPDETYKERKGFKVRNVRPLYEQA